MGAPRGCYERRRRRRGWIGHSVRVRAWARSERASERSNERTTVKVIHDCCGGGGDTRRGGRGIRAMVPSLDANVKTDHSHMSQIFCSIHSDRARSFLLLGRELVLKILPTMGGAAPYNISSSLCPQLVKQIPRPNPWPACTHAPRPPPPPPPPPRFTTATVLFSSRGGSFKNSPAAAAEGMFRLSLCPW